MPTVTAFGTFFGFTTPITDTYFKGNEQLDAEQITSYELGYYAEFFKRKMLLDVKLFREEITNVIDTVRRIGGLISSRATPDGGEATYELNITYFDALRGTFEGEDAFHIDRYLASQTIVMALEGIPALYIQALLGASNDIEGVEKSGQNRAINRHRWDYEDLTARLDDPESTQSRVMNELLRRIAVRRRQKAFHPNATQFTLQIDERLFGLWRQSLERDQSIFALHNVSDDALVIAPQAINLIDGANWVDLLSGEKIDPTGTEIRFAPYQCRWISNRG